MNEIEVCKCKNCPERKLGCHTSCKDYQEFKTSCEDRNRKKRTSFMFLTRTNTNGTYMGSPTRKRRKP